MSLKTNFTWMMVGNLVYAACQWLVLIAIAKTGTTEMVGEYAFALAVTSPVVIFFNLNMRAFQATDAKKEYVFVDYLSARLAQIIFALLSIAIIIFVSEFSSSVIAVILCVSLYKAIESISDIYYGRLQNMENMPRIGRSLVMRGIIFVVSMFAAVKMWNSVALGSLLVALGWVVLLLLHDIKGVINGPKDKHRSSSDTVWRLSKKCLPLGIVTFLVSLNANIPIYVIKNYMETEQLGVFSAIIYFSIAGQFVSGALAQAAAPRLALNYSRSEFGKYRLLQLKLMAIGAGMAVIGVLLVIFLGENLLNMFYGEAYAAHNDVFLWVMISAGIGYAAIFLGTGLTVTRRFREMLFLNVFTVIATLILSIILIPKYGLVGAGWALAASATLKFIINLTINYSTVYSRSTDQVR